MELTRLRYALLMGWTGEAMSTRSRIGLERANGMVESVYCHFDGYPNGVGRTLLTHWRNWRKVERLIRLGNISVLGPEVEGCGVCEDSFLCTHGQTRAYARDRGDTECVDSDAYRDLEDLYEATQDSDVEFVYVLSHQGHWVFAPVLRRGRAQWKDLRETGIPARVLEIAVELDAAITQYELPDSVKDALLELRFYRVSLDDVEPDAPLEPSDGGGGRSVRVPAEAGA